MSPFFRAAAALAGAAALSLGDHVQAQVPSWSLEAQQRLIGGAGTEVVRQLAERQRLAEAGESALKRGDSVAAERAFDDAARIVHSADIEMGLVRSHMQAGDYRRALAFASHAAGAHRNVPAGAALYGWLLHIGGQGVVARRQLDDALQAFPADAALTQARALVDQAQPVPSGALLLPPLRLAPYATPMAFAQGARVVGTALLLGDGNLAVVPAATVRAATQVWVRNALGHTVAADVLPGPDPRFVTLRLAVPLPAPPVVPAPPRDPFAGSPAYMLEFAPSDNAGAAWPLLRQGFFGRHLADPGDRLLGIDLPPGPRGGPVFDAFGRIVGLAVPGVDGRDRLASTETGARAAMSSPAVSAASAAGVSLGAERAPVDMLYELGMRLALQVLAWP